MGLKYSSADSQNLMTAMRNNLTLANQITDRLSSGCDHLISALDSGELKGAAYTAGKGLFTEIIIPSIKKLQAAIDDIQAELTSYAYADSVVAEYGTLDLDNMERQLEVKWSQLDAVEEQQAKNTQFLTQASALFSGDLGNLWAQIAALDEAKMQIQMGIDDLNERIEKLKWFNADVSKYFSDSLTVLQSAIQGALALGNITVDDAGNYYTNGSNMDWLATIKGVTLFTTDRGKDPKLSLIDENIRDLMLSDEASDYYRKQLTALLDGKPAGDWPLIIDAFNRSLLYDDEGNILSIIPFYADEENGYIVLKNGQYDLPYTTQLNQEQSSQFWQSLGEQAAPILLGISEVIGGGVLWLGSSALGAGGLALSIPFGGTVTIPAAVASAGFATSGTLIAGHTITVTDAISQIAAANANLQISFAKKYDEWKASRPTGSSKPLEVNNMSEFFETEFGQKLKKVLQKTSKRYDGQSVYKVTEDVGDILKKGDQIYLDGLHKNHLEVFTKNGKLRTVLNLDGNVNWSKLKQALKQGRNLK